jgi:hypothetical protein
VSVGVVLADFDVGIDWNFKEQQRQLQFLVVGHCTTYVYLVSHELAVEEFYVSLLELFKR